MMKKILSLVLISIMLLSSLPFMALAQNSEYSYNGECAELLYALEIVDTPLQTNNPVTRSQFIRYAMKLAGIPLTTYNGAEFSDVSDNHPDYNYIMSAVDFGLISASNTFRPEDTITISEALKVMVVLLGYDFMAQEYGGYPNGYLRTAQTIELLDGVDSASLIVTESDAFILLCNALNVRLPEVAYSNEGASQYSIGSATILQKYRGIVEVRGVVDGVSHYSKNNATGLGDNRISINGVVYNTGSMEYDMLYGYEVVAYYDANAKKLISCTPTDSNHVVTVYAEDVYSFKNGKFTYEDENSKEKTISISLSTVIFYNGRLFEYDELKMIPDSGSLTFVSQSSSGVCSTLYIKSYKTVVVERVLKSEYIIVDKYADSSASSIVADPDKVDLSVYDQDGNVLNFENISVGDVVCVATSDDKKAMEFICVKDDFLGVYTGYSDDYIQVDGTSYRVTPNIKAKISSIISMGKMATFRLDIDQRIADIIPATGDDEQVGYLIIGKYMQSGLSTRFATRILNLDGNIYDYDFAEKFSVNGKSYSDYKTAYDELKSTEYDSMICGVVKFALNSEGKLKSVVYSDKQGGNGGLYVTNTVEESTKYHKFSKWYYTIGRAIICDTTLKVFKVPNPLYSVDSINDDEYAIVQPGFLTNSTAAGYKLQGYTTIQNDGMSQYLLMQRIADDNSTESAIIGNYPYMVSRISTVVKDGETHEQLELCNRDNPASKPLKVYSKNENDFTASGMKAGDIIRISKNENNILNAFRYVYKVGETTLNDGTYVNQSANATVNERYIAMTVAYRVRTNVLDVVAPDVTFDSVTDSQTRPLYLPLAGIFKYDERAKKVVQVKADEIKDYLSFGSANNTIVYHMDNEELVSIFIVK